MNAEVIIAARGELPDNLKKTVASVGYDSPICIVYDGQETPYPVTQGVRVEEIGPRPRGCGQARHKGILTSEADIVVLCDGHMAFPDGWLRKIVKHLEKNQNAGHLVCAQMQSLKPDWTPAEDRVYQGAFLARNCMVTEFQYAAVAAKWNAEPMKPGPIGAVMGACYAMRREWYDEIGQPLKILEAWGLDEEVLSIGTHIMGGGVHLLPLTVGHIHGCPSVNRRDDADTGSRRFSNHYALVHCLPSTDGEKSDMRQWLKKTNRIERTFNDIQATFTDERVARMDELKARWAGGVRNWGWLVESKIVRDMAPAEVRADMKRSPVAPPAVRAPVAAPVNPAPPTASRPPVTACSRCNTLLPGVRKDRFGELFAVCLKCGHRTGFGRRA